MSHARWQRWPTIRPSKPFTSFPGSKPTATHAPQLRYHGPIPMNPTPQLVESLPASAAMLSRTRFRVLALISVGTMINYLDRTVLGVAAPHHGNRSAHFPGRYGNRLLRVLMELCRGADPGWLGPRPHRHAPHLFPRGHLSGRSSPCSRVSLTASRHCRVSPRPGRQRGAMLSDQQRVVATWFREHERAQATAVYTVGEYLGLACFGPLLFWISRRFGWRVAFLGGGRRRHCLRRHLVGALPRARNPRAPRQSPAAAEPMSWTQIRRLLRYRQIWGASIGQFGGNSTLVFFLTWFPTYLARERQYGLDARRILRHPAIPGRGLRRPPGRLGIRHVAQAHRLAQPGPQAASHRRPLWRIHHHPRQLCDRRCAGDRNLLRSPSSARG